MSNKSEHTANQYLASNASNIKVGKHFHTIHYATKKRAESRNKPVKSSWLSKLFA